MLLVVFFLQPPHSRQFATKRGPMLAYTLKMSTVAAAKVGSQRTYQVAGVFHVALKEGPSLKRVDREAFSD